MTSRLDRPLLLRTAALLLGGATIGLGLNAARPGGVALRAFDAPTTCAAPASPESPVLEMDPRDASALCGRAGVVFADTRSEARFVEGHVADAVHLPCDATSAGAAPSLRKLHTAKTIIVYGETSDDGREVAASLRRRGIDGDLRVLRGGFAAWEREGLACASGPCRDCTVAGSSEAAPQ